MLGASVPGVLLTSKDRRGSSVAGLATVRNSWASGFDVSVRRIISNRDSMHSVARRLTVGITSAAITFVHRRFHRREATTTLS